MRTEDLIAGLAAAPEPVRPGRLGRAAALALALGFVAACAIYAALLGPRPDLAQALRVPLTLSKTLIPAALGVLGLVLALAAARPAGVSRPARLLLALVLAAAAGLLAWNLLTLPAASRMPVFLGHSIHVCLPVIMLMAAPMAALLLRALRDGAAEHPARCGALAGLAAAGLAAALYSTFCTEDQPLFFVTWYGLAMALVTLAGAAAGSRLLRW